MELTEKEKTILSAIPRSTYDFFDKLGVVSYGDIEIDKNTIYYISEKLGIDM